eukprot:scaffold2987_cov170-Amphora_coffeaeformis.AAC.24
MNKFELSSSESIEMNKENEPIRRTLVREQRESLFTKGHRRSRRDLFKGSSFDDEFRAAIHSVENASKPARCSSFHVDKPKPDNSSRAVLYVDAEQSKPRRKRKSRKPTKEANKNAELTSSSNHSAKSKTKSRSYKRVKEAIAMVTSPTSLSESIDSTAAFSKVASSSSSRSKSTNHRARPQENRPSCNKASHKRRNPRLSFFRKTEHYCHKLVSNFLLDVGLLGSTGLNRLPRTAIRA